MGRQRRGVEERFPSATFRVHEDELLPIRAAHHPIPELAATTGDPLGLDRGAEHHVFSALSQAHGPLVILPRALGERAQAGQQEHGPAGCLGATAPSEPRPLNGLETDHLPHSDIALN